jgi:hypothetical protein
MRCIQSIHDGGIPGSCRVGENMSRPPVTIPFAYGGARLPNYTRRKRSILARTRAMRSGASRFKEYRRK